MRMKRKRETINEERATKMTRGPGTGEMITKTRNDNENGIENGNGNDER
jgi:hypothetical protein